MQSIDTLKQDRELLSRQIEAIDKALEVLGSTPNGSTVRVRGRRRWTKAQKDAMAAKQRKLWKERRAKAKKEGGQK